MTEQKQPEALRLANSLQAVRRYKAAAELRRQHAEIESLRAKLDALEKQEPVEIDWPDYHSQGMGCGLEDRGIRDRYEAMRHGWDQAIERVAERLPEKLYLAAGARPVEPAPDAVVGPTNKVLWLLMAQYGLNMTVGQDMDNLLNFGRDVWNAALSATQPAPAAQDDAKDAAQLYPVVIDGLLWLCTKRGGTFKPVDDCAAVNPPLSWKNALAANKKEPT